MQIVRLVRLRRSSDDHVIAADLSDSIPDTEVEDALVGSRIGRPSLSGRDEESPVIATRVPQELRDKLEERAAQDGVSVAEVARDALVAYLR